MGAQNKTSAKWKTGGTKVVVVGFRPLPGIRVETAKSALDGAAADVGARVVRHWDGGKRARYAALAGLEATAARELAAEHVKVIGHGVMVSGPGGELPRIVGDLEFVQPQFYGEVFYCSKCGGSEPSGHEPGCPARR